MLHCASRLPFSCADSVCHQKIRQGEKHRARHDWTTNDAAEFIFEHSVLVKRAHSASTAGGWKLRQDSLRIMQNVFFGAMVETRSTHLARRRIGPQTASVLRSVLRPSFFKRIRSFKSSSQERRSASGDGGGPILGRAHQDRPGAPDSCFTSTLRGRINSPFLIDQNSND